MYAAAWFCWLSPHKNPETCPAPPQSRPNGESYAHDLGAYGDGGNAAAGNSTARDDRVCPAEQDDGLVFEGAAGCFCWLQDAGC